MDSGYELPSATAFPYRIAVYEADLVLGGNPKQFATGWVDGRLSRNVREIPEPPLQFAISIEPRRWLASKHI